MSLEYCINNEVKSHEVSHLSGKKVMSSDSITPVISKKSENVLI